MTEFALDPLTDDQVAAEEALYGPFTRSVRDLVDAAIRTEAHPEVVREAQAAIEAVTSRLRERQLPGSYGIRYTEGGRLRPWGNVVIGLRNPVAPPLDIDVDEAGRAHTRFTLGAAYEGPPGLVHGGVAAMLLDHLFGHACRAAGTHGMTGTLTARYLRGTPLGVPLHAVAWVEEVDGVKTRVRGELGDADGVTVEATAVMVVPAWARTSG